MKWLRRLMNLLPAVVWGIILTASGVGPAAAQKNLAEWAALVGLKPLPSWLTGTSAVIVATTLVVVIYGWRVARHYGVRVIGIGRDGQNDSLPAARNAATQASEEHAYIAFEPGVLLFKKRLEDAPRVNLESSSWFAVFQRSRIANEATGRRYVTMRLRLRTAAAKGWIEIPSSSVWFKRPGQNYDTDLLLSGREQVTIEIAAALTYGAQQTLFGAPLGTIREPDLQSMRIKIVCTARDMANGCERVFEWAT